MNTKIDLLEYNDLVSLSNKELIEIVKYYQNNFVW